MHDEDEGRMMRMKGKKKLLLSKRGEGTSPPPCKSKGKRERNDKLLQFRAQSYPR